MGSNSVGRFSVTEAPALQPAYDYITGNAVGPFIDTGKDIIGAGGRVLGRLYLSKDTVREMAQELGLLSAPVNAQVHLDDAYHRGKLDSLKEELGGDLYNVASHLGRWLDHIRADVAPGAGEEEVS